MYSIDFWLCFCGGGGDISIFEVGVGWGGVGWGCVGMGAGSGISRH